MKKTSVYLTPEEANGLRRLSVREGRSQAELIRDGIRRLIDDADNAPREFKSLGKGHGGGQPYARWSAEQLADKILPTKS
jgi:Arc/MetJ-type ribon-helix-helix transcriptional regulator